MGLKHSFSTLKRTKCVKIGSDWPDRLNRKLETNRFDQSYKRPLIKNSPRNPLNRQVFEKSVTCSQFSRVKSESSKHKILNLKAWTAITDSWNSYFRSDPHSLNLFIIPISFLNLLFQYQLSLMCIDSSIITIEAYQYILLFLEYSII